jgi:hypothetical protein
MEVVMDCLLTIKGDGRGKYGRYKNDVTRPIRDFIIDNVTVYGKVLKHVSQCNKCSPIDIFTEYLSRRRRLAKFNGRTTGTLCELALRYEKLSRKKGLVFPKELLHEVRLRADSPKILIKYQNEFSSREIYGVIKYFDEAGQSWAIDSLCRLPRFHKIHTIFTQISDECPQDLEELLQVADVLLS